MNTVHESDLDVVLGKINLGHWISLLVLVARKEAQGPGLCPKDFVNSICSMMIVMIMMIMMWCAGG